jgi:GAF domain-containing protein
MADSADVENKIIDAIYRGACDHEELKRAVELIAHYFNSTGAVLGELDQAAPEAQFTLGAQAVDRTFFSDYASYAEFDPAPRAFAALATGTVSTTDRLFSADFLRGNIFLNEFLRPRGVDASLGGPLLSAAGKFAMLSVFQVANHNRFEDSDIARLERLMPHLTRALQIRRLFLQSELRGQTLEAMINRNRAGLIGVSGDGPVLFVNDAARAIAAERDGIGLDRHGRILVADKAVARRLLALESDITRGGAGEVVRVARPSGRASYVVLVSPLPPSENLPRARGGILFAIHDPSRRVASTVQRIAHLMHVPFGAAKVVAAILEGIELKDYADREGISMNTVKFHLKTAFDRTGSRTQADLVRRALLALNDLEPYFPGRA